MLGVWQRSIQAIQCLQFLFLCEARGHKMKPIFISLRKKENMLKTKHTFQLWNVLLQYITDDSRLHRLKRGIMKLIGEKSLRTIAHKLPLAQGVLEFQFHSSAVLGYFFFLLSYRLSILCSSLGTCYWLLQDRKHKGETIWPIFILMEPFKITSFGPG